MENKDNNNNQSTALTTLRENLPTIEALIKMNSPAGISSDTIKAKALEELSHFQMLSLQKPEILDCEPLSVVLAVKQVIKKNLSLDPSQGLVYVMVGSVKNKQGNYVKVLETPETANGKLSVARQCGRILDIKRPKITYDSNGQCEKVIIEFLVPSVPAPRWEVVEFDKNNFKKWKIASHRKNSRVKNDASEKDYSNALYRSWNGGIDPEFAATKAIRHSLSKLGTNINETDAKKIVVQQKDVIIEPTMANKEVEEEVESSPSTATEFTTYEVVGEDKKENEPKLPNADEL